MSEKLATILLGERVRGIRNQTFAILVDEKAMRINAHYSAENYLYGIEELGFKYGKFLREWDISNYELINGQRIRFSTGERVACDDLPREGILFFEQGLRRGLEN